MPDRLGLIGDQDTVLGFGAMGMDCWIAESRSQALDALKELFSPPASPGSEKEGHYAVVFITHEVARMIGEEIDLAQMGKFPTGNVSGTKSVHQPVFMEIPSCLSRGKMGLRELTAIVEKAVGIADIMDKA